MRLRWKLVTITAVASIGPILVATLAVREVVERRSRTGFARLLGDGEQEVRAQYRALQREVREVVERLADPEDDFVGRILIALAKGGLDDEMVRELRGRAPRVMAQRGLDVLTVVDPRQRVLASGHFPGQLGDRLPSVPADRVVELRQERLLEGRRPVTRLTVQAWRTARSAFGTRVRVMGGRQIDERFLRRLRLRGNTEARIEWAGGKGIAGPPRWQRYAGFPRRVVALRDVRGRETARVVLAVPDDGLRATLRGINYAAAGLVAGGVLLSLLLGVLAGRISRPLEQLAAGARAVAEGDLERQIALQSSDEIGELVAAFNRMTRELKDSQQRLAAAQRVAAWREIARRIAHEIKNPLSPIQTSMETLRRAHQRRHPQFEEIFDESTRTILEEVGRLKKIVDEFSRFARMPKPVCQPVDPAELLQAVAGLYRSERLAVELELSRDLPRISADREQLTQVMVNLINNASEAMAASADPRITLHAAPAGDFLEIQVRDCGPGFEGDQAAQIFTPYFTTKAEQGGSGLGLAIVHRIVTDHGGTVEARSTPGEGATFVVRLPVAARAVG